MDLRDAAENASAEQLDRTTDGFSSVGLVAHLGLHFVLRGGLGETTRLPNRVGDRLLAIHVFATPHR